MSNVYSSTACTAEPHCKCWKRRFPCTLLIFASDLTFNPSLRNCSLVAIQGRNCYFNVLKEFNISRVCVQGKATYSCPSTWGCASLGCWVKQQIPVQDPSMSHVFIYELPENTLPLKQKPAIVVDCQNSTWYNIFLIVSRPTWGNTSHYQALISLSKACKRSIPLIRILQSD